jgi:hypothetical protein
MKKPRRWVKSRILLRAAEAGAVVDEAHVGAPVELELDVGVGPEAGQQTAPHIRRELRGAPREEGEELPPELLELRFEIGVATRDLSAVLGDRVVEGESRGLQEQVARLEAREVVVGVLGQGKRAPGDRLGREVEEGVAEAEALLPELPQEGQRREDVAYDGGP